MLGTRGMQRNPCSMRRHEPRSHKLEIFSTTLPKKSILVWLDISYNSDLEKFSGGGMITVDVIVAGAGPVGLVAANILADEGVSVLLLENEPELPTNLRASTFQSSTLDMLERFGVTEPLIEMGVKSPIMQYRDRKGWVAQFDFGVLKNDTKHPYRIQVEQFKLCRLLLDRLTTKPTARIMFGARAVDVKQDENGVSVAAETGAGPAQCEAKWLIAADGGKSALRSALGVQLIGFTWPERFLVASTNFDFPSGMPGLSTVSYFADPDEWFFLLKVPGMWRAMFPISEGEQDEVILSDSDINRRLQRVYAKSKPYDVVHRTIYAVHQRVAERYRVGRAFLAGDAAHLNNPLGGMGMNGGMHDGFSIGERLAAVIKGRVPESTLDGYEPERRPVALEYVDKITTANKRNLETRDPAEQKAWRETMDRTSADPELARQYLLRVSMIESIRKSKAAVTA
jgi:3-(3-hydroxy-phenyl)propionate hydroxylase